MNSESHSVADRSNQNDQALDDVFAEIYLRGDRIGGWIVLAHLLFALSIASIYSTWFVTLLIGVPLFLMVFLTTKLMPGAFLTRAAMGIGLLAFCALHIYQMHGMSEMHFFFFTSFTVMILYEDLRAIVPGVAFIVLQHTLFAILTNSGVNVHFFPESHITMLKLIMHFGIAVLQVVIAYYVITELRALTIKRFEDSQKVLTSKRALEFAFEQIEKTAGSLSQSSLDLANAAELLSSQTQAQAAGTQQAAASLEQMAASMSQTANSSKRATSLSEAAQAFANQGNIAVSESTSAIQQADVLSGEISTLVDMLSAIAFQTQILGVNAAIEAAIAGEHGRGFQIVSAEVRDLATKSTKNATSARTLIATSLASIRQSADCMCRSEAALTEIVSGTSHVLSAVTGISQATGEQANAIREINKAVSLIDQRLHENMDQTTSVLGIATALSVDAGKMKDLLTQLRPTERSSGDQHAAQEEAVLVG